VNPGAEVSPIHSLTHNNLYKYIFQWSYDHIHHSKTLFFKCFMVIFYRYLKDTSDYTFWHEKLAHYFEHSTIYERKVEVRILFFYLLILLQLVSNSVLVIIIIILIGYVLI